VHSKEEAFQQPRASPHPTSHGSWFPRGREGEGSSRVAEKGEEQQGRRGSPWIEGARRSRIEEAPPPLGRRPPPPDRACRRRIEPAATAGRAHQRQIEPATAGSRTAAAGSRELRLHAVDLLRVGPCSCFASMSWTSSRSEAAVATGSWVCGAGGEWLGRLAGGGKGARKEAAGSRGRARRGGVADSWDEGEEAWKL
jgi:hypothetical protein